MRKVYVSLGSNKGGEFLALQKSNIYSEDFVIYAFEPEPRCFMHIENVQRQVPNITHIKKGVATTNGVASFQTGNLTVSGTMRTDKTWGLTGQTQIIETIDICEWLNNNIKEDDYVILTMDIEGTEYDILPTMLEDKCCDLINKMYVEFHGNKMKNDTADLEESLRKKMQDKWGHNYYERFVEGDFKMFNRAYPDLDPNMFNNIGELD
jgi:FkbM family methyltransferase